jgi:[ribosomal protein S18]-alanine N-acetyltransferase
MEICQWEYEKPYNVYNFKGKPNGYLLNKDTWGKELFCLINKGDIIGQIAC